MDYLQKELSELREFIADLKADRAVTKEKEQRESWTKYASLSIVFIAVLTGLATQWGGKYSSQVLVQLNLSTFNQAQASDQWSFYQAKSIKQNLAEVARDNLARGGGEAATNQALEDIKVKISRYEKEKEEIKTKAEQFEKERNVARDRATFASEHAGGMGTVIAIFQIAIALGSVCLLIKKRPLWFLSMAIAAGGALRMWQIVSQ